MVIPLFQSASDAVQLLSIREVTAIGLLIAFGAYQVWQNKILKDDLKAKDAKIDEIILEHRKDLKDSSKDAVEMVSRYHTFVEQLERMSCGRKR